MTHMRHAYTEGGWIWQWSSEVSLVFTVTHNSPSKKAPPKKKSEKDIY